MGTNVQSYQLDLQRPEDVSEARRLSRKVATQLGCDEERAQLVQLLTSELLSNVHRHCAVKECLLTLMTRHNGRSIRVEVHDSTADLPTRRHTTIDAPNGRGLALLDLATCWGSVYYPSRCQKVVFFECAMALD